MDIDRRPSRTYNVLHYKAVGDGITYDTNAFLKAWEAACSDPRNPTILIPRRKTFLIQEFKVWGPCRSPIYFKIQGNIVAPNAIWSNENVNLLTFLNVDGLTLEGSGEIDGRGQVWWDCEAQKTLAFLGCNNLIVRGIKVKDSASKQVTFYKCNRVRISSLKITAPDESPNTDGMLITGCQYVSVRRSTIGTGDDCIAIGPDSRDINISSVTCGPGHGFSIGSLGGVGTKSVVKNIRVTHSSVSNALTGVRIKTWQGGRGVVRDIVFKDIDFAAVTTPVVIDQYYCPSRNCQNKTSSIAIRDVRFEELRGSSSSEIAIKVHCSKDVPCKGIVMDNVSLNWADDRRAQPTPAKSSCYNALDSRFHGVTPQVECRTG
ncbi:hypothetical protein Cni_G17742 [Canna indica]|uniref:Polygalacturonase n=1 Tax=Canna indica TaxID=4628 RepID=A0AAQ3KI78_9LILI|nr:hypothetical protein Cni_G17742 [Canna indica]